jgi:hypothetical protein
MLKYNDIFDLRDFKAYMRLESAVSLLLVYQ